MPEILFGPYTLVKRLAVGGMAEVYLARFTGAQGREKSVVVKQILPQLARDPELLQLFFDEAAIAKQLAHPGIVQVFDVGQHDGTHYIAMELVDGLDLDDLVRREIRAHGRGLLIPVAVRVVLDLARAVHYAHEAKDDDGQALEVIHRDISPQNVLLGRDGAVKLSDFGIARTNLRATRTQTGVLRGKISYLAPERFEGERADRTVDVYAMGVVLFEAIAGRRPFVGDDALLIKKIMHEPAPLLSSLVPGIDPRLDTLLARTMAKTPESRIGTAKELADNLEALGVACASAELGALVAKGVAQKESEPTGSAMPASAPRPRQSTETLPGRLDDAPLVAKPEPTQVMEPTVRQSVPIIVPAAAPSALSTPIVPPMPAPSPIKAFLVVCAAGLFVGWLGTKLFMGEAPPPAPIAQPRPAPVVTSIPALEVALDPVVVTEEPLPIGDAEDGDEVEPPRGALRPKSGKARGKRNVRLKASAQPRIAPAVSAAPVGEGELSIDADPWAYVTVDGKSYGATPLAHIRLAAGNHRVVLENPEEKASRTVPVTIRADQRTTVRVRLSDGKLSR